MGGLPPCFAVTHHTESGGATPTAGILTHLKPLGNVGSATWWWGDNDRLHDAHCARRADGVRRVGRRVDSSRFARLDTPLSAQDVAEETNIPLSTVYRALDRLTDADLAERKIVIREDGNRVFRFVRATDELSVGAGGGELELAFDGDASADGHATPAPSASD